MPLSLRAALLGPLAAVAFTAVLGGCSIDRKVKKLDNDEFKHYYALKVYMNEAREKEYLKLKTREDRDKWLQDKGLWDKFYKYDPATRELIYGGHVEVGWSKDMLLMAWGKPIDSGRPAGRQAERSELFVYRFEETQEGGVLVWESGSKTEYKAARLFTREVYVDDGKVAKIVEKDGF
jgi:hypothetical protein